MEDIERLKKISEMSRELQKHGIAVDSEDALKQSEEIYQAERPEMEVDKDLSVKQGIEVTENVSEGHNEVRAASSVEFQQFVNSVNERLNKVEESVSSVVGKINEIIKEINRFEARLDSGGVAPVPKESQTTIVKPEAEKPNNGETQPQSRAGDYTPGDVQIDKIFYYGNK